MTLALLLTAVGGAWADEVKYPIVYDFEAAANAGENPVNKNGSEINGQKFYGWENETYTDRERKDYKGYEYAEGSVLPKVCHVWRRGDRINGNVNGYGGLKCPSNKQMAVDGLTEGLTVTIIYDATNATDKEIVWAIGDGSSSQLTQPRATATINGVEAVPGQTTIKSGDVITVNSVTEAQNGSGYIVFKVMKDMVIKKIIIDEAKAASGIKVTTNAVEEGATFTQASFQMQTFDVDVNYTLVRDMQDQTSPVAFSGLPSSGNIVVKKGSDGKYQSAETLTLQLIDPLAAAEAQNIIQADGITVKVGEMVPFDIEGSTYYQLDKETLVPLADFLADMKPGLYKMVAESTDENSPYDGTVYSSQFTVVEQYDLTVKPANDFSKNGLDAVTVGSQSVTIDANTGEATKTGIAPDTQVKLKAKRGYIIDKVEAKKKGPAEGHALTSAKFGEIVGSDGKAYAADDKDNLPKGVTVAAKVCYVDGNGHGLALALADEAGEMNWSTAQTTCAAHTPAITGGTWKLATKDEWSNMITAAGSHTALRDGFSSVGGTNMQSDFYWSSTPISYGAWYYTFDSGKWSNGGKGATQYVRACLAF